MTSIQDNSVQAAANLAKSRLQRRDPYNTRYAEERLLYERLNLAVPSPPTRHDRERISKQQ